MGERWSVTVKTIKENQIKILELKNTRSEIKIWLNRLNTSLTRTDERVGECEDGSIENIQPEEQTEKKT